MPNLSRLAQLAAALAISVSVGAQPTGSQPGDTTAVDTTTQTDDVRFKDDISDRMTVPVLLSGAGPYRFLVDTGADRTAISRQIADHLKLEGRSSASLHSVSGVSVVETTDVPSLQLSRGTVAIDNAPLLEREHMGADGILGVDSLNNQRVLIDFSTNTMSIVPSATRQVEFDRDAIVITAKRRYGRLIFTNASVNGRSVTVVLDTGSQVSIGNSALLRALRRRSGSGEQTIELQSVTGENIEGQYSVVRDIEIGGMTIHNLAVVFADAHTFRKLEIDERPALLLGMDALRVFKRVSIDFANRKFRVIMPESSSLDQRMANGRPIPSIRRGE